MPPEIRKQLTVGYFLVCFVFLILFLAGILWPALTWVLAHISDPVGQFLVWCLILFFGAGVLAEYVAGFLLLFALGLAVMWVGAALFLPLWGIYTLATMSVMGAIVGSVLLAAYIWGLVKLWQKQHHSILQEAEEFLKPVFIGWRLIVEFFAWIMFIFRKRDKSTATAVVVASSVYTNSGGVMPNSNPKSFASVQAEIKNLHDRNPDLPQPPKAFFQREYEGWFREAQKRFEMESFGRTEAERIEVVKKIEELNRLWLSIAEQENRKSNFSQESRIRKKELNNRERRLDYETEDMEYEREQVLQARRKAKDPPVASPPPRDAIQDAIERVMSRVKSIVEAEAQRDRYKKLHPEYGPLIDREFAKVIGDLRERP